MTRMIDDIETALQWNVPAFWCSASASEARVPGQTRNRPGLLDRLLGAVLAAEARFREAQRIERMCDRMRRDVGLPVQGAEARRQARLVEEWQRWW